MFGILRPLGPEDAGEVAALFAASRAAAMPWLPVLHTPEEDRAFFARQLAGGSGWAVADDAGSLAGFAVTEDGWLQHLYVAPDRRGQGVGGRLLAAAWEESGGGLQLWAFAANTPALAFYRSHGFVEVERTDGAGNEERMADVRMMRGTVVRPATAADAEAIAHVHVAAWRAAYVDLLPADLLAGLDEADRADRWRERLSAAPARDAAQGATEVLVADREGSVVGFVAHGPARDEDLRRERPPWWEVYALYLDPPQWGVGLGGRLWRGAARRAGDVGAAGIAVWALAGNARAGRAYRAWGLTPDGARRTWEHRAGAEPELRYAARLKA